jgi:hypothetical protein
VYDVMTRRGKYVISLELLAQLLSIPENQSITGIEIDPENYSAIVYVFGNRLREHRELENTYQLPDGMRFGE